MRTPYERLAHLYDVDRAHWTIEPDEDIASLSSVGPVTVLDVGCGTAIWLCAQREHFPAADVRLLGVDPSGEMLSQASAKAARIALARGRAERLPIADGAVDYAYSSFAFHHFEDKPRALDELARVLRGGGGFRMRNMDPWSQPDWWLYTHFEGTWETDQVRFWPPGRIASELERRGFDVDTDVERTEAWRSAADVLEEAERRVISQLAIVDDAAYDAGIAALRAYDPDDRILYRRGRLTLRATKRR